MLYHFFVSNELQVFYLWFLTELFGLVVCMYYREEEGNVAEWPKALVC